MISQILNAIGSFFKNVFQKIFQFIKSHKKISILLVIILCIVIAALVVVNKLKKKNTIDFSSITQTTQLEKMDLQSSVSVTGSLISADSRSVTTNLSNIEVEEVNVSVGDYVNAGDVIVTFDSTDLEYNYEIQQASNAIDDLKSSKSLEDAAESVEDAQENYTTGLTSNQQDVNSAYANYVSAQAAAKSAKETYEKIKAQYDSQSVSGNAVVTKEQVDAAAAAYEKAQTAESEAYGNYYGRLNDQTSNNEKNADQIEESEYNYKVTGLENSLNKKKETKQLQEAEEQLGKVVVTSPISGYITSLNVEAGDTYNGEALFVVQDLDNFVVDATVDEYDISKIKEGQEALVKTDATGDTELAGVVTYVAMVPQSSSSSSDSGASAMTSSSSSSTAYEIQITLSDTDEDLRVGMTAKTGIILESVEDVFAVAYDSIQEDENGYYIEVMGSADSSNAKSSSDDKKSLEDKASADTDESADTDASTDEDASSDEKPSADNMPSGEAPSGDMPDMPSDGSAPSFDKDSSDSKSSGSSSSAMQTRKIYVEKGMESDYYVEISSDELQEGMMVVTTVTQSSTSSSFDSSSDDMMDIMGGGDAGGMGGGAPSGGGPGGGF